MFYIISFVVLSGASAWFWQAKYVPAEVAQNAAAIKANGSADDLQRGFHSREAWSRVWPGLACCLVPAAPLALVGWGAAAFGLGAMAALLLGLFVRYFTPLLNLAMQLAYKPEWYASPASKSWPDAAAWKQVRRAHYLTEADQQAAANILLEKIILTTYRWCLLAALVLASAAVVVASRG